jgi:transposase
VLPGTIVCRSSFAEEARSRISASVKHLGVVQWQAESRRYVVNIVYPCCCGLDVHKKMVVACLIAPGPDGRPQKQTRTFSTMTQDLLALADWLTTAGCSHVAMESTGIYWKPVYNLLAELFEVLVVNAQHIKAVPGRKTDVRDAEWIADLLRHGLLKGSFIPPTPQRDLRDLTRHRTTLVQERARIVNRLHKVLEDANLKLTAVTTDVTGVSARAMLEALLAGETDPATLANLAQGKLRTKVEQLEQALTGHFRAHHAFLLSELLSHIDYLDEAIARVGQELETRLQAEEQAIEHLDTIPGVNRRIAEVIIAEIGTDMQRFPSAKHLASWAGMSPGNHQSAGKQLSGKTRKGSRWLRQALVEAAQGAVRSKNTYLSAQDRRLAARRGKKRATIVVGHSILVIIYHLLTRGETYQDLGGNYFDEQERHNVEQRLVHRLERLGYHVDLQPIARAA